MTEQVRRATRLMEIEHQLRQSTRGLKTSELAERTGYSARTIQRDLVVLESELGVPLIEGDGRRWKLMPGSTPIGSVRFSLQEARAMYLATRQFFRHSADPDPDAVSALQKLATALPPAIATHVRAAATQLKEREPRPGHVDVIRKLTEAWADSHSVTIRYRSQRAGTTLETRLDPYLLEPSPNGAATYAIGYSHSHSEVRMFKLDRIVAVTALPETFVAQDIGEVVAQLRRSWGVVMGDDEFDVVVEFTPAVAERVRETNWHPSQQLIPLGDGGVRLQLRLPSLLEFEPWVRSWGPEACVVAPPELRQAVAESLRAASARYESVP